MEKQSKVDKGANRLTTVLFIIYLLALCWILLLKVGVRFSYMEKRSVNLIPFNDPSILTSENILNVVIFVPLGIYIEILFKRWNFARKLFSFFVVSSIVEGLQYVFGIGAADVTDIITNTFGGVIGLLIFRAIKKAFNSSVRAQKLVNAVAVGGTVLMVLLLVLLKMNMLPVRFQ